MTRTPTKSKLAVALSLLSVLLATGIATGTVAFGQQAFAEVPAVVLPDAATQGLEDVAASLRARERALDRREADIAARESDLRAVEAKLDVRLHTLEALRGEVLATLEARARVEAEKDAAQTAEDDAAAKKRAEIVKTAQETADAAHAEDVVRLVKMMETMRPKEASAVLTQLDRQLAVDVLDRMSRTKAGRALAALEPKLAADLAERMTTPIAMATP